VALLWLLDNPDAAKRREALTEKGWRIPPHLFPPGTLPGSDSPLPGTEVWLDDFFELGTDRSMGGRIPAASIARHVEGWPDDEAGMFRFVIRELDQAYLAHLRPDGDVPVSDNPARDAFRARMK
jgi:hypothetical protein